MPEAGKRPKVDAATLSCFDQIATGISAIINFFGMTLFGGGAVGNRVVRDEHKWVA
jgi:hypothetical protein